MKQILIIFLFSLSLSQCAHNKIVVNPNATTDKEYSKTLHYTFWGLTPKYDFTFQELCETSYVQELRTYHSFLDSFLSMITIGIYSPKTLSVKCSAGNK